MTNDAPTPGAARRAAPPARALALAAALVTATAANGCAKPFLSLSERLGLVSRDSVALDLWLVGDAGHPAEGEEPVLKALVREVRENPDEAVIVWLGDNIYPHGLPDSTAADFAEAAHALDAQIEAVKASGARGIFVPGNHDWDAGSPLGLEFVRRQERYVRRHGGDRIEFLPGNGCPGPVVRDLPGGVRLLALDTQWWLHGGAKPTGAAADCGAATEAEVVDSINHVLGTAGDLHTIVVGHHPVVSGGIHGGYFDWYAYLFPFYPWARQSGFANQDVASAPYRRMRGQLERAFANRAPLIYAAGHEHNLQVLRNRGGAQWHVVSGGGIYGHTTRLRAITGTQYAARQSGFLRVTVLDDGRVRMTAMVVDAAGNVRDDYSAWVVREPRAAPGGTSTTTTTNTTTTSAPAPAGSR